MMAMDLSVRAVGLPPSTERALRAMVSLLRCSRTWHYADDGGADVWVVDADQPGSTTPLPPSDVGRKALVVPYGDAATDASADAELVLHKPLQSADLRRVLEHAVQLLDGGKSAASAGDRDPKRFARVLFAASRCRAVTPDGAEVFIEPSQRRYYGNGAAFLKAVAGGSGFTVSAIAELPGGQAHALDPFMWRFSRVLELPPLPEWFGPDKAVRLSRWPDLASLPHTQTDLQMAAILTRRAVTAAELGRLAHVNAIEVRRFLSGMAALTLLSVAPSTAGDLPPHRLETAALGVIRRIRERLGL